MMSLEDKKNLEQYRQVCELLNSIQKRMDENSTDDGAIIDMHHQYNLESDYYATMKECDFYVWYFSQKGMDVEQLLEEQNG